MFGHFDMLDLPRSFEMYYDWWNCGPVCFKWRRGFKLNHWSMACSFSTDGDSVGIFFTVAGHTTILPWISKQFPIVRKLEYIQSDWDIFIIEIYIYIYIYIVEKVCLSKCSEDEATVTEIERRYLIKGKASGKARLIPRSRISCPRPAPVRWKLSRIENR